MNKMNFYEVTKKSVLLNEEKSFIKNGIISVVRAVKNGQQVGFLTARTNRDNHMKLLRQIMIMVALEMSDEISNFKENLKKVKKAFNKEFFFFVNDNADMKKKLSAYMLPNVDPMDIFAGSSDQRKAYVLKILSDVYNKKFKFFDDEDKNLETAKKLEIDNKNIRSYNINHFMPEKLKDKVSNINKIFLFDIDGTLIDANATVWIVKANGQKHGLTQEEFATGKFKMEIGDKLDFSEFADRKHLIKLAKEFNEIIRKTMIERFSNMQLKIENVKMINDAVYGTLRGKKIVIKKMPDNNYVMEYDGSVSKAKNFSSLLQNIKKYFLDIKNESISTFKEARLLKLGLKRIDKNNNNIYRHKNYFAYLNHFDEENNFAFIKEESIKDFYYLLTEKELENYKLKNIKEIIAYLESNKKQIKSWNSFSEMIAWLKDNRQLPINESYFRDIMILED